MRPEPLSGGGAPPAPFACSGEYMPGVFFARAVLMLGIRPDCLRSEPRL